MHLLYPFEFVMAQILFHPLIVWKAIFFSRLFVTPFFMKVDDGKWQRKETPSASVSPQPLHCFQQFLPIDGEEFHDGGEVGAGKHLLDLLVMRGDLGVFIMASWKRFFFRWKQIPGKKKPEVNQHPLPSLIYIHPLAIDRGFYEAIEPVESGHVFSMFPDL